MRKVIGDMLVQAALAATAMTSARDAAAAAAPGEHGTAGGFEALESLQPLGVHRRRDAKTEAVAAAERRRLLQVRILEHEHERQHCSRVDGLLLCVTRLLPLLAVAAAAGKPPDGAETSEWFAAIRGMRALKLPAVTLSLLSALELGLRSLPSSQIDLPHLRSLPALHAAHHSAQPPAHPSARAAPDAGQHRPEPAPLDPPLPAASIDCELASRQYQVHLALGDAAVLAHVVTAPSAREVRAAIAGLGRAVFHHDLRRLGRGAARRASWSVTALQEEAVPAPWEPKVAYVAMVAEVCLVASSWGDSPGASELLSSLLLGDGAREPGSALDPLSLCGLLSYGDPPPLSPGDEQELRALPSASVHTWAAKLPSLARGGGAHGKGKAEPGQAEQPSAGDASAGAWLARAHRLVEEHVQPFLAAAPSEVVAALYTALLATPSAELPLPPAPGSKSNAHEEAIAAALLSLAKKPSPFDAAVTLQRFARSKAIRRMWIALATDARDYRLLQRELKMSRQLEALRHRPPTQTQVAAAMRLQRFLRRRRRIDEWLELVRDLCDWELLQAKLRAARAEAAAAAATVTSIEKTPETLSAVRRVQRFARSRRRWRAWREMIDSYREWMELQEALQRSRGEAAKQHQTAKAAMLALPTAPLEALRGRVVRAELQHIWRTMDDAELDSMLGCWLQQASALVAALDSTMDCAAQGTRLALNLLHRIDGVLHPLGEGRGDAAADASARGGDVRGWWHKGGAAEASVLQSLRDEAAVEPAALMHALTVLRQRVRLAATCAAAGDSGAEERRKDDMGLKCDATDACSTAETVRAQELHECLEAVGVLAIATLDSRAGGAAADERLCAGLRRALWGLYVHCELHAAPSSWYAPPTLSSTREGVSFVSAKLGVLAEAVSAVTDAAAAVQREMERLFSISDSDIDLTADADPEADSRPNSTAPVRRSMSSRSCSPQARPMQARGDAHARTRCLACLASRAQTRSSIERRPRRFPPGPHGRVHPRAAFQLVSRQVILIRNGRRCSLKVAACCSSRRQRITRRAWQPHSVGRCTRR